MFEPRSDKPFEQHELRPFARQPDQSRQNIGNLHDRQQPSRPPHAGPLLLNDGGQIQAAISQLGLRMAGVDGHRGQHGKDRLLEVFLHELLLLRVQFFRLQEADLLLLELGQNFFIQAGVLSLDKFAGPPVGQFKLVVGTQLIGDWIFRFRQAMHLGPQARDPDHHEFIEIAAENAEKLDPLQQWIGVVLGFFQHARVEFQPAQFAIDEVDRAKNDLDGCGGRIGRRGHIVSRIQLRWPDSALRHLTSPIISSRP